MWLNVKHKLIVSETERGNWTQKLKIKVERILVQSVQQFQTCRMFKSVAFTALSDLLFCSGLCVYRFTRLFYINWQHCLGFVGLCNKNIELTADQNFKAVRWIWWHWHSHFRCTFLNVITHCLIHPCVQRSINWF